MSGSGTSPMAQSTTPFSMRKKRKPGRPRDEVVRYMFEIASWDWAFSFGVSTMKHDIDPFMDFRHLEVQAVLLRPTGIVADKVELSFLPNRDLNEDRRQSSKPTAVGSVNLRQKRLTGIMSMPLDALGPILEMLSASRFHYIDVAADKMRYGSARVHSYHFQTKIDEDDLPD